MTWPEKILWARLRRNQVEGLRFRRQHPLGPYIADFYCHEAGLVVEVDGMYSHSHERIEHDRIRDRWMTERGIAVLRVSAISASGATDRVVERIRVAALRRLEQFDPYLRDEAGPDEPDGRG